MLVRVLGPVMVTEAGAQVPLPGSIPTRILAMLTTNLATGLRTDALIDGVWGADATEAALATLQSHVARLRRAIGEEAYQSGSWSQATSAFLIFLKAIETVPTARWHIRQWHR